MEKCLLSQPCYQRNCATVAITLGESTASMHSRIFLLSVGSADTAPKCPTVAQILLMSTRTIGVYTEEPDDMLQQAGTCCFESKSKLLESCSNLMVGKGRETTSKFAAANKTPRKQLG